MKTLEELEEIRKRTLQNLKVRDHDATKSRIVVGMGTCGISAGARTVLNALIDELNVRGIENVTVTQTGCIGMCTLEPMFDVYHNGEKTTYVEMDEQKARRVIVEHIINQNVVTDYVIKA